MPGLLQAVSEFEVLVTVTGEALVETADAHQVGAPDRRVAGKKVQPRQSFARRRMEVPAFLGMIALARVVVEVSAPALPSRRRRSRDARRWRARWRESRSGDARMSESLNSTTSPSSRRDAGVARRRPAASRLPGRWRTFGCSRARRAPRYSAVPSVELESQTSSSKRSRREVLREQRRDDVRAACRAGYRSGSRRRVEHRSLRH